MCFCGVVNLAHLVHSWLHYRRPQEGTESFHSLCPAKLLTSAPISAGRSYVSVGFFQHARWVWTSISTSTKSLIKYYLFVRALGHLNLHRSRLALEWFLSQVPLKGIWLITLMFHSRDINKSQAVLITVFYFMVTSSEHLTFDVIILSLRRRIWLFGRCP